MKNKILIFLCLLFSFSYAISAQSVYTYNLKKDIIIGSTAIGLSTIPFFINRSSNLASETIELNKNRVNSFDRSLMYEYNKPIDITSDVLIYGLLAMPVLSLTGNFTDGHAWLTYGIMYAEAVLLIFGTTEIMKKSILRYRPYNYFGDIPSGERNEYYKSFPSRHTAFAFMSAGFLTTTFFNEYPNSPWRIPICVFSYSLATAIGTGRLFSGSHFLSDILVGASIGTFIGYIIPKIHFRGGLNSVLFSVTPSGFKITWRL